jgi:hypothetical protein
LEAELRSAVRAAAALGAVRQCAGWGATGVGRRHEREENRRREDHFGKADEVTGVNKLV